MLVDLKGLVQLDDLEVLCGVCWLWEMQASLCEPDYSTLSRQVLENPEVHQHDLYYPT